jgi:large subunit ribosomal protein L29
MKASDLREKSGDDLRELEKSLVRDVFQNRLKNFTNRLDDTSAMRKTKRDLARVITLLREQALGIARKGAATQEHAGHSHEGHAHEGHEHHEHAAKGTKPAKAKAPKAEAKAAGDKPSKPGKSAAGTKKTAAKTAKKDEAK